jgi:hypothetical protein
MNPEDIDRFSLAIEERVCETQASYIDAVVTYCEEKNLDLETAGKLVAAAGVLKSKIHLEAIELHYLKRPKTNPLPL